MIPVRLTIEGLYSYQERQTIDFAGLTGAGLFGIFGAVGSGKSSVLEAISYVLYGETERLNAREKRTYNMMNLKSNRAYIEFDFYNHENKLFRATLELKRNSKRFEDVYSPVRVFYEIKDGAPLPLEHTDAEKILGLSYQNFKRTIIIPQGQFKEFLELGDKDRTQMMKEIFQLHRFDLQDKVALLKKETTSMCDHLEGRLKGYDGVSEEELQNKRTAFQAADETYQTAKKAFESLNDAYQQLKHLKKDADLLTTRQAEFATLEKQQSEINSAQQKLDEYERVSSIFSQLILDLEKSQKQKQTNLSEKEKAEKELAVWEKELSGRHELLESITPYFENLQQKKQEENDLALIVQILGLSAEIQNLDQRASKGYNIVQKTEEEEKKLQSLIAEKEKLIPGLNAAKLDGTLLLDIGNWYLQQENISTSIRDQTQKITAEKERVKTVNDELIKKHIQPETFEKEFEIQLQGLKEKRQSLEQQKSHLEVHHKLAEYQSALHHGEPCPLCGSTEHPRIMDAKDVTQELIQISKNIQTIDQETEGTQKRQSDAEKLIERKTVMEQNLRSEEAQSAKLNDQLKLHLSAFRWQDFKPDDPETFLNKKEESASIEKQLKELHDQLNDFRKQKDKKSADLKTYQKALDDLRREHAAKEGQQASLTANLRLLKPADFAQKTVDGIKTILENLIQKNKEIESQHQSLTRSINQLNTTIAAGRSSLDALKKRSAEIETEINALGVRVQQNLKVQQIENIGTVRKILAQQIDVPKERNRIRRFEIQFETLRSAIKDLREKLAKASFSNEKFIEAEQQWTAADNNLKAANDLLVRLGAEVEQLKRSLEEKKKLIYQYEELKKRGDNLQIIFNLFKGSGFVEYISSIYLSQLCDQANVRFHRMTRNQLSLQLGENNDFEIIDYLNEGHSRSVKTLSGGQSFQVSLSLALALAEGVQSNARAEKNFFFIDEGFGTQDADSINVIFETLVNLNREHKIVGIISHVEELKDRIPRAITIVKDPDKGSRVYGSE